MRKFRTVAASVIETVNGFGIVKYEEYWVTSGGKLIGRKNVWYYVCLDDGKGKIVGSYRKINVARKAVIGK